MEYFKYHATLQHRPLLHLLSALLFMISSIPGSLSEIKDTRILDDSRPLIIFEQFGYAKGGKTEIIINDFSWKSRRQKSTSPEQLNPSSLGFFLVTDSAFSLMVNESEYTPGFCPLTSKYIKIVYKFEKLLPNSSYNGSAVIDDPDEYVLLFGNCQPEFQVSMDVKTEMYNFQNNGKKDYLPAGETQLPLLYFVFFCIYTFFLGLWASICMKNRPILDKIHIIMAALLLVKALKLVCASEDKLFVSRTGTPHGWDVAFYVFGFFKGIMLFTVIILIGTGWSFLKPYLQEREKNVLMTVIPLQVLENIAYVVINETGPATKDWMAWNHMFLLIDIICCAAVFFPIIWSIRSLKEASRTDGKAARNLQKLTLFKQFYIVVVGYLYFTRIVVPSSANVLSYRFEWIVYAAAEVASLAFYIFIFYKFQPTERNPYLVIDDQEEIEARQILEEDDSFEL